MENKCSNCQKPANNRNAMVTLSGDGTEKYIHYSCFAPPYDDQRAMAKTASRKPVYWTRR